MRTGHHRAVLAAPALSRGRGGGGLGSQLRGLAGNLLPDPQDAEECLNDAYLGLWNSIPPAKPQPLLPYALRVVRNLCLKRYHYNRAGKRNRQLDVALLGAGKLLGRVLHAGEGTGRQGAGGRLEQLCQRAVPPGPGAVLGRYWYGSSYKELALKLGITEGATAVRLSRLRDKLRRPTCRKKGVLE